MMQTATTRGRIRKGEEGYTVVTVIFLVAILTLALSVAMPSTIKQLQRDRDLETYHRGKQYERAVKLYYRQFHAYPPTIEALVQTNKVRFLRQKYKDPTTGHEEWKLIHFGEAKTKPLGFFGKPIEGAGNAGSSVLAGTGPSGGNGTPGGLFPSSGVSGTGTTGQAGGSGSSSSGFGSTSNSSSSFGQTFGGLGIVGVSPGSDKHSVVQVKQKDRYSEWEFVYDPAIELYEQSLAAAMQSGNATGNPLDHQNSNPTSSTFGNNTSTFGGSTQPPTSSSPTP